MKQRQSAVIAAHLTNIVSSFFARHAAVINNLVIFTVRVRDSPGDPATCKLTLKNENMTISCCCIKKYEMTHDFTER